MPRRQLPGRGDLLERGAAPQASEVAPDLHDITVVSPSFHKGRHVGFFACTAHIVDIGGRGFGAGADCTCTPTQRRAYAGRIGGPLLDRIDLRIDVPPMTRAGLAGPAGESSAVVAERVRAARAVQADRWSGCDWRLNAQAPGSVLRTSPWRPSRATTAGLDRALDRGEVTLRGYDRVLRVAWTVADSRGRTAPGPDEVTTAMFLRSTAVAA